MDFKNITSNLPKEILVKEAFKRPIPSALIGQNGLTGVTGDASSLHDPSHDPMQFEILTQSDFLREYNVTAHKINSLRYYPNPVAKDKEGKLYTKIKSRTAIAYQAYIHTKRLTALTGNNANLRLIEGDQENLVRFRKGWEKKNIETAIHQAISADGKVGDVAIQFYFHNGRLGWRTFDYEKGDTLYPHYDPITGELALFGRRYITTSADSSQVEYLDVWDETNYCRWKKDYVALRKVKEPENDGWEIDITPVRHGFRAIPIAYDRYGDTFWGMSQTAIENQENAVSQLAENNMAYALRILYAFGEQMDVKASIDGTPIRIDSSDPNARVGFLEPADASNSFTLQLKTNHNNIMRSSFVVEAPEIKSGSDMSSLTVKTLYADAYLKALDDAQHFQAFIDKIVELYQYGYFLEIGTPSDASLFTVKAELFPYIFQSETEVINGIVQLKGIGALSRQSSSEMAYEYGFGIVNEDERIKQEEHDELVAAAVAAKDVNVVANAR